MIEESMIRIVRDLGFPIFVASILLYDKVKTNGKLVKVVENNNLMLKKIEMKL